MKFTTDQLKTALLAEHEYISHDTEVDYTVEQYAALLEPMSYDELVSETGTDSTYYTLSEYMDHWV